MTKPERLMKLHRELGVAPQPAQAHTPGPTTVECIEQSFIDFMSEHLGGNLLLCQENAVRYAFDKSAICAQLLAAPETAAELTKLKIRHEQAIHDRDRLKAELAEATHEHDCMSEKCGELAAANAKLLEALKQLRADAFQRYMTIGKLDEGKKSASEIAFGVADAAIAEATE